MEHVAELIGAVVRAIFYAVFEAFFSVVFDRVGRLIGFVYDGIYRMVRWNLRSDLLAVPVTILLMLALGGALFFALVKAIQWMIA